MKLEIGRLRDRVRFERKVAGGGFGRAGKEPWEEVATVWAEVQDTLPSRSERTDDGLPLATRTARVRVRWRPDFTSAMRIVHGDRIMEIIAGPAVIGHRDGLEMVAQDYSTAGGVQ